MTFKYKLYKSGNNYSIQGYSGDPMTMTEKEVQDYIQWPKSLGTKSRKKVSLCKGKFGFYLKWGKKNISVKAFKTMKPAQLKKLTLTNVEEYLT